MRSRAPYVLHTIVCTTRLQFVLAPKQRLEPYQQCVLCVCCLSRNMCVYECALCAGWKPPPPSHTPPPCSTRAYSHQYDYLRFVRRRTKPMRTLLYISVVVVMGGGVRGMGGGDYGGYVLHVRMPAHYFGSPQIFVQIYLSAAAHALQRHNTSNTKCDCHTQRKCARNIRRL